MTEIWADIKIWVKRTTADIPPPLPPILLLDIQINMLPANNMYSVEIAYHSKSE